MSGVVNSEEGGNRASLGWQIQALSVRGVAVWGGVVDILLRGTLLCTILLPYIFPPSLHCERDSVSLRLKSGSVSVATFFKKKKSETNYLICRAASLFPLTKSVQCAPRLTWGKPLTALDSAGGGRTQTYRIPPPPWEVVSLVLQRGSFWLSVITGTLAESVCHGYNRARWHTPTMKTQRERLQIPGLTLE